MADNHILKEVSEDGVLTIVLNRPQKFNALTAEMYYDLTKTLNDASDDNAIKLITITGAGDYFCSGNDISNFKARMADPKAGNERLRRFVEAFINQKKPVVALVNGPSIGITVTILAICDHVVASDKATFLCPFSQLGITPEGSSTFMFPMLMGHSKAMEFLLGQKLTAKEAYERNLVTRVVPHHLFHNEARKQVQRISKLPLQSIVLTKQLVVKHYKKALLETNIEENNMLDKTTQSEECKKIVAKFLSKKQPSKL